MQGFNFFLQISHAVRELFSVFQKRERLAGLLVERERIRFAEFQQPAVHPHKNEEERGHTHVIEGAVRLASGTIRHGTVAEPDKLIQALRALLKNATPNPLTTPNVILSVPLVRIVGQVIRLPIQMKRDEIPHAVRLATERILPFPIADAYIDWEPMGSESEKKDGAQETEQQYLVVAATKSDVDPYLAACAAAGLHPVAVEPITMSISRGLRSHSGAVYIAVIQEDALLAAGIDAGGKIRFLEHRTIPEIGGGDTTRRSTEERAQRITAELISLIRFFRAEIGGAEYGLMIDGILDEMLLRNLQAMANSLGVPLWIEEKVHELSRAATKGATLRAALSRRNDRFISLMPIGTEEAYAKQQAAFFVRIGMRLLLATAMLIFLFEAATFAFLAITQRSVSMSAKDTAHPSGEISRIYGETAHFNDAVHRAAVLLGTPIDAQLPVALVASAAPGISVERIAIDVSGGHGNPRIDLSVRANRATNLTAERDVLTHRFTDDTLSIPSEIFLTQTEQIPFVFSFVLRENPSL